MRIAAGYYSVLFVACLEAFGSVGWVVRNSAVCEKVSEVVPRPHPSVLLRRSLERRRNGREVESERKPMDEGVLIPQTKITLLLPQTATPDAVGR